MFLLINAWHSERKKERKKELLLLLLTAQPTTVLLRVTNCSEYPTFKSMQAKSESQSWLAAAAAEHVRKSVQQQ